MKKQRILCVDDESDILELLKYNLEKDGYVVETAENGQLAIDKLQSFKPELILLDIMMPVKDGLEVCKYLRNSAQFNEIFIIFLTAKSDEIDEILGLEVGADDYIAKPFSPRKILAKLKAIFRRHEGSAENEEKAETYQYEGLIIDRKSYTVSIDKQVIRFLHKEFELLYFLMSRPEVVFSRDELLASVWGEDAFFVDRTVDVHITKIRKKIGKYAGWIQTISGVGYKFSLK